jgi:hypothetical protein
MVNYYKRLNHEFGDTYRVIDTHLNSDGSKTYVPKNIKFPYKGQTIYVCLNKSSPFHAPDTIDTGNGMWLHERYQRIQKELPYLEKYIRACSLSGDKLCLYCRTLMKNPYTWSPSIFMSAIVEQFIYLDRFIADSIKTEVLYRNYLQVPDELFDIIFSYLHSTFSKGSL